MSDVVVQLPVRSREEQDLFGDYLTRFMESCTLAANDTLADGDAAPFVMVRSEPRTGEEWKVVTFQQPGAALAFSHGWAAVLGKGASAAGS